jgi:nucleoside-diphosphate-sugar epimerase
MLCTLYAKQHGLEPKIARCYAFVGPYLPLDIHFAIGNFIRDAIRGVPIRINGDGTPWRSYLYTADLVTWLWVILFKGRPSRAYNVGSENAITISCLADSVAQSVSPSVSVQIARQPVPGKMGERYVPSTGKARSELGLRETVDLDKAIKGTSSWHQS